MGEFLTPGSFPSSPPQPVLKKSFPDQLTTGCGCRASWAQGLACCQEPADPGAPDHPLSSMQVWLGCASQVPSLCGHGV